MDLAAANLIVIMSMTSISTVIAVLLFQRYRVAQAKRKGEHSALMDDPRFTHKEARPADEAPNRPHA